MLGFSKVPLKNLEIPQEGTKTSSMRKKYSSEQKYQCCQEVQIFMQLQRSTEDNCHDARCVCMVPSNLTVFVDHDFSRYLWYQTDSSKTKTDVFVYMFMTHVIHVLLSSFFKLCINTGHLYVLHDDVYSTSQNLLPLPVLPYSWLARVSKICPMCV